MTFPKLKTARLVLSKLSMQDIPAIVTYAGNKKVAETTLNIPHPYSEEDAVFWINKAREGFENKTQYTFAIRILTDDKFIGGIGLIVNQEKQQATLGYWVAEPFWNNGYATEAVGAILDFGFKTVELLKISATYLVDNPASGKVMLKNGMTSEGELPDQIKKGTRYKKLIQYSMRKAEFNGK